MKNEAVFDKAIKFILQKEGGYVNDAIDLGGITNYGISFRFLKNLAPELGDIDEDGDIDAEDIAVLTQERAILLYRKEFWDKLQLKDFPQKTAIALMDTAVNMGNKTAVKLLQKSVNNLFHYKTDEDGIIGPDTIRAAGACGDQATLIKQFLLNRIWRYQELVENNKKLLRFLSGWIRRVRDLELYLR